MIPVPLARGRLEEPSSTHASTAPAHKGCGDEPLSPTIRDTSQMGVRAGDVPVAGPPKTVMQR
jgi:hypothetical protein